MRRIIHKHPRRKALAGACVQKSPCETQTLRPLWLARTGLISSSSQSANQHHIIEQLHHGGDQSRHIRQRGGI